MSDSIKNKLYNLEEIPPASAWEKVTLSLDEKFLQNTTITKLYNQEKCPPEDMWVKISASLDIDIEEARFRNEILEDEVAPPPFTWKKIVEELDAAPSESISKKILAFEVDPPSETWNKISASLHTGKDDVRVISMRKSNTKIFRIAAAAVVVGVFAWVGFSVVQNYNQGNDNDNSIANNDVVKLPTNLPVVTTAPPVVEEINNTPTTDDKNSKLFVAKKPAVIKNSANIDNNFITDSGVTDSHATAEEFVVTENKNLHKKHKPSISTGENITEARYLIYLNEQGKMVNLSKKLADLKCIYTKDGEISQEALAKLDATDCNDQVKYWQDKMANSSLQSSSNPLELIDALK